MVIAKLRLEAEDFNIRRAWYEPVFLRDVCSPSRGGVPCECILSFGMKRLIDSKFAVLPMILDGGGGKVYDL